jgi:hypothetical protein
VKPPGETKASKILHDAVRALSAYQSAYIMANVFKPFSSEAPTIDVWVDDQHASAVHNTMAQVSVMYVSLAERHDREK